MKESDTCHLKGELRFHDINERKYYTTLNCYTFCVSRIHSKCKNTSGKLKRMSKTNHETDALPKMAEPCKG